MYQMSKKVIRQSNMILAQENGSMKKIAKKMTVQMNLLLEKISRRKQLPKKELSVKRTNCNFLLKLSFLRWIKLLPKPKRNSTSVIWL